MRFIHLLKKLDWRSLLSVCAVVTSMSGLYVSNRQLQIASEAQQASVFPYLTMAYNNSQEHIELFIRNEGNGPAFISGVEVRLRDSIYSDFWTPVTQFFDTLHTNRKIMTTKSDLLPGWVIRPDGGQYTLFRLNQLDSSSANQFWRYYSDKDSGIEAKIWYLDLYNNCWVFDFNTASVERCEKCPKEVLHR
jgi:hypothetical protein